MIVAVTGGRDYVPKRADIAQLRAYWRILQGAELRVGDCPAGVDAWIRGHAPDVLDCLDVPVFRADWTRHGNAAGPIRNGEMLRGEGHTGKLAEALLVFPGGRGTSDCKEQAERLGIQIYRVDLGSYRWYDVRRMTPAGGPWKCIVWDGTWQRRVLWDGHRFRSLRGWPGITEPICWRENDPAWGR